YLLIQRFSHLSLVPMERPEGLGFKQSSLDHTHLALTVQEGDGFSLHRLFLTCYTSPSFSGLKPFGRDK
ncbi:MAG: hypothetical protein ACXVAV_13025, partial [Ktedonobacteraceae bacterium]